MNNSQSDGIAGPIADDLVLGEVNEIERPVSPIEYYHASIGTSKKSTERSRECILIMPGSGTINAGKLRDAVHEVAKVNPGTRLRWIGKRRNAIWKSDGSEPSVRVVPNCGWDARSNIGSDFIYDTNLLLENGPTVELLIVSGRQNCLILRTLHAIMDGFGMLHFLREIFRALRGERLIGSNAAFSDFDLVQRVSARSRQKREKNPAYSTGGPGGTTQGDSWKVIELNHLPRNALTITMSAVAEYAARYSSKRCIIALPISLRRHLPQINSTCNYASMIHIGVSQSDSSEAIKLKINRALDENADTAIPKQLNWIKFLPLPWLDRIVSRTQKNYRRRKIIETAVISKLGYFSKQELSGGGFVPERLYTIPIEGNTMISISSIDAKASVTVGMENIYGSEGRFEELSNLIEARLLSQEASGYKVK